MNTERDAARFLAFLVSVVAHSVLATCDRLRTSCGFIHGKRLRGIGYNGSVSGEPHCDDVGHWMTPDGHCVRTRHGEKNGISNTDRQYLPGSETIIIATPCIDCVKDQIEEGVKKINYVGSYDNAKGKEFIAEMAERRGVVMNQFEVDWCEVFQKLFDLLARKGGVLHRSGYRLKVTKEPFEK
ncbi:hypothetical protein KGQ34_02505 [Patescibacteria group bacterium]|nr:hypothetical protein [Patescibacteria group bacterium]